MHWITSVLLKITETSLTSLPLFLSHAIRQSIPLFMSLQTRSSEGRSRLCWAVKLLAVTGLNPPLTQVKLPMIKPIPSPNQPWQKKPAPETITANSKFKLYSSSNDSQWRLFPVFFGPKWAIIREKAIVLNLTRGKFFLTYLYALFFLSVLVPKSNQIQFGFGVE